MEERVLLLLLDTPEFAVSFFGAIKIGAVPTVALHEIVFVTTTGRRLGLIGRARCRVGVCWK